MPNRHIQRIVAAVAVVTAGSCYQDDFSGLNHGQPPVRVSLTDAPFPYDSVASVNVYVVRIEANAVPDTTGGGAGQWVLIAEPRKSFDLLTLQQGSTAFVGQGELPAGQYHAIRMTIDTSFSSVVWKDGSKARVNWNNYSGSNEEPLYALVEYPVNITTDGAEIVIDFDVGRSFLYDFFGTGVFTLAPQLRAINSAAAGAIAGTVMSAYTGVSQPIKNANVTVCGSAACDPPNANIVATGRSDAAGHYNVAFLRAGSYTVRFEQAEYPFLIPVITPNVQVTAGGTTALSASLPQAGDGKAYIHLSGPTSIGVGGYVQLVVAVGDSNGNPVAHPVVTWSSSDSTVAHPTTGGGADSVATYVQGLKAGVATIYATSGGLTDSLVVQVYTVGPVAMVTVVPESATVVVGDTGVFLEAVQQDSAGHLVTYPGVSFATPDTLVLIMGPCGSCEGNRVWGRAPGTGIVYATSNNGKVGHATITVH